MRTGWASLGGEVYLRPGPASAAHPQPPLQRRCPQDWALDRLPLPAPLPFCPLAFLDLVQRPSSPGWGGGEEGEGQCPGPRSQPVALPGGPRFAVRGQRSRDAGAPSQQAFMRHPVARRPSPRSHALVLPLTLPPKSAPHSGHTQESHQLPPLSRGPAAPRASLDGSLAAVSSSSSSSSSPSVNSSWPGP